MTAPGGGGDRLEVSVVADATGFAKDAQAKIDAAVSAVKAKIRAELDATRLQGQLAAEIRKADTLNKIKLKVEVDGDYLRTSLARALSEATGQHTIKVGVDVDRAALDRALADSAKGGGTITQRIETIGGGDQKVNVGADTTAARTEIDALIREESSRVINVPVQVDQSDSGKNGARGGRGIRNITGGMGGLQKAGFYAGLVQTLGSAVDALGSGLISVAGASSQAMGALAVLPNLAGTAAQGIGALLLGFSGIGDAVTAMGKAQTANKAATNASAKAQIDAARRIQDARKNLQKAQTEQQRTAVTGDRSVAQAQQGVDDAVTAAADRLHAAEEKVTSSQVAAKTAQAALTQARADAEQQIKDYKDQLADAALSEESATLAIERARESWNKTMRSPVSTELDRKEADLALRQAEQNLTDIQDKNAQLRAQADKATTAGVEGAASVVAAKQTVVDTTQAQADAEAKLAETQTGNARDIADAQAKLAEANEKRAEDNADALDRVATAQLAVTRAIQDSTLATGAAATANAALAAAMDKLSPAGKRFATFVSDTLKPKWTDLKKAVQESLLPPVQEGVTAALPLLGTLQDGLVGSAGVMGGFIKQLGTMMGTGPFRADVASIMASNNDALGHFTASGLDLVTVFQNLAVTAEPLLARLSTWVQKWADYAAASSTAGRETGKLQAFMQRAGDRAAQLGDIVGNLIQSLFHMGKAGTSAGDTLLDKLQKLTQKWADWTGSADGQNKMKEYFDKLEPSVEKIGGFLSDVAKLIVDLGSHSESLNLLLSIFDGIAKALDWIFKVPILGPMVAGLMGLAGIAAVLLLFIKRLSKIKELFDTIGKAKTSVGKAVGRISDKADSSRASTTADRTAASTSRTTTGGRGRTTADRANAPAATPQETRQAARDRLDRIRTDTSTSTRSTSTRSTSTRSRRGSTTASRSSVLDDLDDTTANLIDDTGRRLRGGSTTGTSGRSRTRRAGSAVGRAGRRVGGATVGGLGMLGGAMSGMGGGGPKTVTAANGDVVGGLGAKVAGFATSVQKASDTASKYLGGWAGDATKTVGDWAGKASVAVTAWADTGVGKAVSTAGGYVSTFASDNSDRIGQFAKDAGTKMAGWASDAATTAGRWASNIGSGLATAGTKVAGWASDAATTASGWASKAGTAASDLATNIGNGLSTAGTTISGWAGTAKTTMSGWASTASTTVSGWGTSVSDAAGKAKSAIGDLASAAAEHAGTVKNKIVDMGGTAIDAVKGMGGKLADWAKGLKDVDIAARLTAVGEAIMEGATWLLNAALDANPIVLIGLLIVGLIAIFYLLITNTWGLRDKLVAAFEVIRDKVVGAFGALGDGVKNAWNALTGWIDFGSWRDRIVGAFETVRDKVGNAFQSLKDNVSRIWDQVKDALKAPAQAVVDVVYNNGLRKVYNWVNDLWSGQDWPEIRFAKGGVLDSRTMAAAPGYKPGHDTLLAAVSPGEGFLVPEAVRGLGGPAAIQAINSEFSSRVPGPGLGAKKKQAAGRAAQEDHGQLPGYFLGGVGALAGKGLSAVGHAVSSATGWVGDRLGDVHDLIDKGWKAAVNAALGPVRGAINGALPGGGIPGDLRTGVDGWLDKLADVAGAKEDASKAAAIKAAGNVSGNVAQWAPTVAAVLSELGQSQASLPWVLQLIGKESGGNATAINNWDINAQRGDPSRGLMQTIGSTFNAYAGPYRSAGIYDGKANIYAGLAYGISRYGSVMNIPGIRSMAAGGGYKPYDTGGRWADGTTGINTSGKDEGVLTGRGVAALGGWARLDALNSGTPLAQLVSAGTSATAAAPAAGGVGTLIAEGAIQVTTVNPAPEPASDTLNKTLRRVADLGIFGAGPTGGN